jgi:hypothetical protein
LQYRKRHEVGNFRRTVYDIDSSKQRARRRHSCASNPKPKASRRFVRAMSNGS